MSIQKVHTKDNALLKLSIQNYVGIMFTFTVTSHINMVNIIVFIIGRAPVVVMREPDWRNPTQFDV